MNKIRLSENQKRPIAGFERLWVWQKAHNLMEKVHNFCKSLPRQEKFRLSDQIERSSASICANIAEGYSSYYYQEKIRGFNIARKEVGETQNHIRRLCKKNYLDQKRSQKWVEEYEEIIRGINGYMRYIREKRNAKK